MMTELNNYNVPTAGNPLRCGLCTNKKSKKQKSAPGDKADNYTNMDVTSRRVGLNSFK